jgi:hypothetical protein
VIQHFAPLARRRLFCWVKNLSFGNHRSLTPEPKFVMRAAPGELATKRREWKHKPTAMLVLDAHDSILSAASGRILSVANAPNMPQRNKQSLALPRQNTGRIPVTPSSCPPATLPRHTATSKQRQLLGWGRAFAREGAGQDKCTPSQSLRQR